MLLRTLANGRRGTNSSGNNSPSPSPQPSFLRGSTTPSKRSNSMLSSTPRSIFLSFTAAVLVTYICVLSYYGLGASDRHNDAHRKHHSRPQRHRRSISLGNVAAEFRQLTHAEAMGSSSGSAGSHSLAGLAAGAAGSMLASVRGSSGYQSQYVNLAVVPVQVGWRCIRACMIPPCHDEAQSGEGQRCPTGPRPMHT
jgi:hypothetical protein